jgi:hypothetical protein
MKTEDTELGLWAVFKNLTGTKNSEASESVAFYKIRRNSGKFDRNAFDERKEHEIFENTKIGRICRMNSEFVMNSEFGRTCLNKFKQIWQNLNFTNPNDWVLQKSLHQ